MKFAPNLASQEFCHRTFVLARASASSTYRCVTVYQQQSHSLKDSLVATANQLTTIRDHGLEISVELELLDLPNQRMGDGRPLATLIRLLKSSWPVDQQHLGKVLPVMSSPLGDGGEKTCIRPILSVLLSKLQTPLSLPSLTSPTATIQPTVFCLFPLQECKRLLPCPWVHPYQPRYIVKYIIHLCAIPPQMPAARNSRACYLSSTVTSAYFL